MARSGEPDWSGLQGAHIVDDGYAKRTRCGIKVGDRDDADLPYLGAVFVERYRAEARGFGVVLRLCRDCEAAT